MFKSISYILLIISCNITQFAFSQNYNSTSKQKININNCKDIDKIYQEVSKIRNLRTHTPIKCLSHTPTLFHKAYLEHNNLLTNHKRLIAEEFLFKVLRLIPNDYNYQDCYLNPNSSLVKVFYSDPLKSIVTKDTEQLQIDILAHEVVHAIQEQNFALKKIKKISAKFTDTAIGLASILEGDAILVQKIYLQNHPRNIDTITQKRDQDNIQENCQLPLQLQELYDFPYLFGYLYAKKHGFEHINQILRNYQNFTTKEILEKKLIEKNSINQKINISTQLASKQQESFNDSMGQQFIRLMFSKELNSIDSMRAGMGWFDDRIVFYKKNEIPVGFYWSSKWISEADSLEYQSAWIRYLSNVYKLKLHNTKNLSFCFQGECWEIKLNKFVVSVRYFR
jgi:hypothetical protein